MKRGDRVKFTWNTLDARGKINLRDTFGVVVDVLERDENWPETAIVRPDHDDLDIECCPLGLEIVEQK